MPGNNAQQLAYLAILARLRAADRAALETHIRTLQLYLALAPGCDLVSDRRQSHHRAQRPAPPRFTLSWRAAGSTAPCNLADAAALLGRTVNSLRNALSRSPNGKVYYACDHPATGQEDVVCLARAAPRSQLLTL